VFGEILQTYLKDARKARILRPDGTYTRSYQESAAKPHNGNRFSAQDFFIARAEGGSTENPASMPVELASRELGLPVVA
jgi:hypothetical protein